MGVAVARSKSERDGGRRESKSEEVGEVGEVGVTEEVIRLLSMGVSGDWRKAEVGVSGVGGVEVCIVKLDEEKEEEMKMKMNVRIERRKDEEEDEETGIK